MRPNHKMTPTDVNLAPTWIALLTVWFAVLMNQPWIFGLLFLAWAIFDIVTGKSSFVQNIPRQSHPVAFWVVVFTWLAFACLYIAYSIWSKSS